LNHYQRISPAIVNRDLLLNHMSPAKAALIQHASLSLLTPQNLPLPLPALQADHQLSVTGIDREIKLDPFVKEMPVIGEDFLFEIPGQHVVHVWWLLQLLFNNDRNMHPR